MSLVPKYLFNNNFDDFFDLPMLKNNIMKSDIFEENGHYIAEVEIPGFNKEDIKIDYEKGYLTISAKKENIKEEKVNYIRKERFYGEYQRTFYVGEIDEHEIKAHFDNGLLKVSFPKGNGNNKSKKTIMIE